MRKYKKKLAINYFMNEVIRTDIMSILSETRQRISHDEISYLKELSDHTIHNASIFQDKDSINAAVIVYSLYKILQREGLARNNVMRKIIEMENALAANDLAGYNKRVQEMLKMISKADIKLKLYIEQVVEQAQIKKGSKLYDHGLSISQAANLMGISVWELMDYVGKTEINEDHTYGVVVDKRLENARRAFSKKK